MRPRCSSCGRFLRKVFALVHMFAGEPESVSSVQGICAKHGEVEAASDSTWSWDYWASTAVLVR